MALRKLNNSGIYNPYSLGWDTKIDFPNTRQLDEYGNRIYNRYPARSIFLVPRSIIFHKKELSVQPLNILDPFMGSGTTAVEASLQGCNIFGIEMDPFARVISEVSIYRFSRQSIQKLQGILKKIYKNWNNHSPDLRLYPSLNNIEYWFDTSIFSDLLKLKSIIYSMDLNDKQLKFFQIVFADCIKPSSKMERQSTKPYISSKYEKVVKPVLESFQYSFDKHIQALSQYIDIDSSRRYPKINWVGSDATNFNSLINVIDLAITSPPYLNAFDYTQLVKVESAWLGSMDDERMKELRKSQVGHEQRINNEVNESVTSIFQDYYSTFILSGEAISIETGKKTDYEKFAKSSLAYFNDLYNNLLCVYRALKPNGEYHIIVGDNVIKGIEIPTHKIIADIATSIGFNWFGYYFYPIKDHRTSIPRNGNGGKIRYEYVISFRK